MLKGKSWKEKMVYFWMYYKTPVIAAAAVLAAAGYWLHAVCAEKEPALYVLLLDSRSALTESQMEENFAQETGIDLDEKAVTINTSYLYSHASSETYAMTSLSRFYADIGTGKLDVCGFLEEDFVKYAGSDTFLDLRLCLDEETLAEYGDFLYYRNGEAVGIYTEGLPGLKESGCYEGERALVGIVYNSGHVETAAKYLRYLS